MLIQDPEQISSVLDFLSKKLGDFQDKQNREIIGIERMEEEKKKMFYLVKCKELDGKSLLEYIDSENVRLSKQREELIELSVKIANLNNLNHSQTNPSSNTVDTEKAQGEVINHYKSGLPSGVGLRDMIVAIEDHFPWSSSKKKIKIFLSLVTCLLGIGLFVSDLTTDVEFSLKMFENGNDRSEPFHETIDFDSFLSSNLKKFKNFPSPEFLHPACDAFMKDYQNYSRNSTIMKYEDYETTGWISVIHCVLPFIITVIIFLSMNACCEGGNCSASDISDKYLGHKSLVCCNSLVTCCYPDLTNNGIVIPIPGFTDLYRFWLEVRSHIKRSKHGFKDKIADIEKEIKDHEAPGKI